MPKTVGAAQFKADCLRLIDQMSKDGEPVSITKHGRPVALLRPIAGAARISIVGALQGSVLRYDDPFAPAITLEDWDAGQ